MKRLFVALCLAVALVSLARPVTVSASQQSRQSAAAEQPININNAGLEELVRLPGVGQVTAERIVAYREANGPFARVDDLVKVKGIGRKTLEKLRAYLVTE